MKKTVLLLVLALVASCAGPAHAIPGTPTTELAPDEQHHGFPSLVQPADITFVGSCPVRGRPGFLDAGDLEICALPNGLLIGTKGGTFGFIPDSLLIPGNTVDWTGSPQLLNVSAAMKNLTQYAGKIGGLCHDPHLDVVWVCSWEFYNTGNRNNLGIGWFDPSLSGSVFGAWRAGDPSTRWVCATVPNWNCTKSHFDQVYHANKTHEWVVAVPDWWSETYAPGYHMGSGRQRPAGSNEGAAGPCLTVWRGDPAVPAGEDQGGICVLAYPTASRTWSARYKNAEGDDTGTGAAWIDTGTKSALVYCWTKGDPDAFNCYDDNPVPPCDPVKGWHLNDDPVVPGTKNACPSSNWATWEPMLYFYDPVELGEVALGHLYPWEVQPYLELDVGPAIGWPDCDATQEGAANTAITWWPARSWFVTIGVRNGSDSPTLYFWAVAA